MAQVSDLPHKCVTARADASGNRRLGPAIFADFLYF
jgi:hypothetical protein